MAKQLPGSQEVDVTTLDVTGLPEDKVKYLEQLIESWRHEDAKGDPQAKEASADTLDQAWQALFRIGDALAEGDTPEVDTLTSAVLSMRR